MQRKYFISLMILIASLSLLYAGWLTKLMNGSKLPVFYFYLRYFLVGWVLSSVIVAFVGSSRQIGGIKSFLISLFNPALGLIMVLASETKSKTQLVNVIKHKPEPARPQLSKKLKNSSYTLNA